MGGSFAEADCAAKVTIACRVLLWTGAPREGRPSVERRHGVESAALYRLFELGVCHGAGRSARKGPNHWLTCEASRVNERFQLFEASQCAGAARELVGFNPEAVEHGEKEIRQRGIVR